MLRKIEKLYKTIAELDSSEPCMRGVEILPYEVNGPGATWIIEVPCHIADAWTFENPWLMVPINCPIGETTAQVPLHKRQVYSTPGYSQCMLLDLNFITALCAIRTIVDSYNKDGYNFIREYWIKQGIKLLNKKISECSGSTIDLQFVSPEGNYEALVGPMENKET